MMITAYAKLKQSTNKGEYKVTFEGVPTTITGGNMFRFNFKEKDLNKLRKYLDFSELQKIEIDLLS